MLACGSAKFQMVNQPEQQSQFIALQYLNGVDLIDFLKCKGALPQSIACHIFKSLAKAIMHIHQNGLVHRDIKSDNIIITKACKPLILDFGFSSKSTGDLDNGYFTTKLGTSSYMAPEIHHDTSYEGIKADIFALAIILFQMMTGRPPFEEAKKSDFLYKCIIANRPDIFWRTHKKHMRNEIVIDKDI